MAGTHAGFEPSSVSLPTTVAELRVDIHHRVQLVFVLEESILNVVRRMASGMRYERADRDTKCLVVMLRRTPEAA